METGLGSLLSSYDSRIATLKSLLLLRGLSSENDATREALEHVALQISALEGDIGEARGQLVAEAALLTEAADLQRRAARSTSEIASMGERLPAHLPGAVAATRTDRVPLGTVADENGVGCVPKAKQPSSSAHAAAPLPPPPPLLPPASAPGPAAWSASSSASASAPWPTSARPQPPHIQLVTDAELRTAPSYMRSRIDVGKVNAAVSDVQRLLGVKYAALAAPAAQVRAMHEVEKRKHGAWKLGETPEMRGVHFFDEGDFPALTQIRNDATGKNLLAILRHVGRLKEFKHKTTGLRCWRVL